ncbi:hypothetical protein [Burkholderia ubonensis]|uniref:hypothetical protein n=1 Tax=Burkholderia ubonensis TaxID=101571 RepID=UPI000AFCA8AE|nr:hypothetical protein [Burkholderia ubonensis]
MTKPIHTKCREGRRIQQIRALMADRQPRTAREIADTLDISLKPVNKYLRAASTPGETQEVHSIDRRGNANAARFVVGKGKNVPPRRDARKAAQVRELTDDELDAKHKSLMRWWPAPDLLVIGAINNMVRMGVQAC